MIFPFGDFFCRSGLAGNPPADPFKTAASASALTLASGAPWVQSSTVSASGQRVWLMRRLRSSRSACGTARVKAVMASFIRRILCSISMSANPVAQPLFGRRQACFNKRARVLGVVPTEVTNGLVAGAVVPGLRRLHGRPLGNDHPQDVLPF